MALLLGPEHIEALRRLREEAVRKPVDVRTLRSRLATEKGRTAIRDQMTAQTVEIPVGYLVSFSIEIGHPDHGVARHASMSVEGHSPIREAIWWIVRELGFVGCLDDCYIWNERLIGHGEVVNVAQLVSISAPMRATHSQRMQ
jgi:hypothetical protein